MAAIASLRTPTKISYVFVREGGLAHGLSLMSAMFGQKVSPLLTSCKNSTVQIGDLLEGMALPDLTSASWRWTFDLIFEAASSAVIIAYMIFAVNL